MGRVALHRYFEDVEVGYELPSLTKEVTLEQQAMYAAATWDIKGTLHYDSGSAQKLGLPAALAEGPMVAAFLAQVVTDWMGASGTFRKMNVSYRGMVFPGDRLVCKGKVARIYRDTGQGFIQCQVSAENQRGDKVVYGTALVTLPCRDEPDGRRTGS